MTFKDKIGYIVSERKIQGLSELLGQVKDESLAPSGVPILIIGWNLAKSDECYRSILDKSLGNMRFWTFSRTEKRSELERDLKLFEYYCLDNILKDLHYEYLNPITMKYSDIKELLNFVHNSLSKRFFYLSDRMVYFYYKNAICGISMRFLEYCRIGNEKMSGSRKIWKLLAKNKKNILLYDKDNTVNVLSKKLCEKKYALPFIFSITNAE